MDELRIADVLAVPGTGAGYYEDQAALQAEHVALPQRFSAGPLTPGFDAVRQIAEAISVGLVLEPSTAAPGHNRSVAWGDCVAVSYSGVAGRDRVFRHAEGLAAVREIVTPLLRGRGLSSFRALSREVDGLTETAEILRPLTAGDDSSTGGVSRRALLTTPARILRARDAEAATERVTIERPLHTAVRYGTSQALLQAVALNQGISMAEVIAQEWALPLPNEPVAVHAQSGSERYYNAEKMIAHRIKSLPHALVDDIQKQVGSDGGELTRYVRWLARRIGELGGPNYAPTIHLDLHGALGQIYDNNLGRVLGQLYALALAAQPYPLRIESPMVMDSREAQIKAMSTLRSYVRTRKMQVQLVADEWANSLEGVRAFVAAGAADMIQIKAPALGGLNNVVDAILACRESGVGSLLGGSYAETDLSARVSVHVALATRPDLIMAKPGMGVDEAISITRNEMQRTLAWIQSRRGP
jgi:methylaspartate ammonia-lyase